MVVHSTARHDLALRSGRLDHRRNHRRGAHLPRHSQHKGPGTGWDQCEVYCVNIYKHTFSAVCPSDGETIIYRLEIRSNSMIHVEHIKAATALIKKGWHEQIADRLSESLGGEQLIVATHHGVEITTVRLQE
ncbi:hypothetical protein D3C86_1803910 [compost metagenome]